MSARALAASNAVKDEFLGLVSHELRTPVTTIFGNARLLQERGRTLGSGGVDGRGHRDDAERLLDHREPAAPDATWVGTETDFEP